MQVLSVLALVAVASAMATVTPIPTATPIPCTYTCTGDACPAASGSVAVGSNTAAVCGTAFPSDNTTCTGDGAALTAVCNTLANVTAATSLTQWNNWAAGGFLGPVYSRPSGQCTCNSNPTCPTSTDPAQIQPSCSGCLTGCNSTRRQVNVGSTGVTCPTATTLDQARKCFERASCNGNIRHTDTCVFGTGTGALTSPCPGCSSSKKGLLGLLGLLALLPLLLCSLLLCCLLGLCRRTKTGAPQHVGTFEQPQPYAMEVPMQHATMHTTTHMGPAIQGGPMVGGPMVGGPVVGPTVF